MKLLKIVNQREGSKKKIEQMEKKFKLEVLNLTISIMTLKINYFKIIQKVQVVIIYS